MVLIQDLDEATLDQYDQVNEKLGVDDDPPAGLLIHTASEHGGGVRIVDVWESEDAWNRFREERLMAAVIEVFGEQDGPPQQETHETHHVIKP
jgi:hypothetical protein